MARVVCIAGLLALLPVMAPAANGEPVVFTGRGNGAPQIQGQLFRPPTPAPVPAVIALHGCGGLARKDGALIPRHADWAARWVAAGYAVLFPDSFASRGLGSQCQVTDRRIRPRQRADDAAAAADWLATQTFIDKSRIALVGWSNGGGSALYAARSGFAPARTDFRAVIAFYPGCRVIAERETWLARLPVTILMGGADDWTPPAPCRALGQRANVRYVEYPGAYHDFDAPDLPVRLRTGLAFAANKSGTAHIGTDPAARAAAIAEVTRVLAAALK